jgi:hypothetical protein
MLESFFVSFCPIADGLIKADLFFRGLVWFVKSFLELLGTLIMHFLMCTIMLRYPLSSYARCLCVFVVRAVGLAITILGVTILIRFSCFSLLYLHHAIGDQMVGGLAWAAAFFTR